MTAEEYDILIIQENINNNTVRFVRDEIKKQASNNLYLVIDTLGGSPEAGFRIMQLLNARYDTIEVLVPDKAMSTGTLMALGADRIYMFHSSSLGPLDLQIEHPADGSWISTLDVRDTMNTIISHSEVAAKRFYRQTYIDFGLSKVQAAKIANENAQKLLQPIVNKIDPYHLHKSFRSAAVGEKYASTLLCLRMMKGVPGVANAISAKLANDYSAHNYAITLEEARDTLLLTVEDLSTLKEWDRIEPYFTQATKRVEYINIKPLAQSEDKSENTTVKKQGGA